MIRAVFFIVKIALLSVIAIWVAEREGDVSFVWHGTDGIENKIHINLGLFLLGALLVMLLALTLFRIFKGAADFPKIWARYRDYKTREKGYRALTLGLTAVAAGDSKTANYQAFRAEKFMPQESEALTLLLQAQSARLAGDEERANQSFAKLVAHKDASFLGVRGLLQSAMDRADYGHALDVSREALALHPRQPWILKITYELEIRQRHLDAALKTLYRAEKEGAISPEKAMGDKIAMLLYQADKDVEQGRMDQARRRLEKAYKYSESNIPTVLRLARYCLQNGKRSRAVKLIEKAWRVNTHPDLVPLWESAMPKSRKDQNIARLQWFERLLKLNPQSSIGHMAVAKAAMDAGLWGEARNYLDKAEEIRPGRKVYQLYALLAEKQGESHEIVQNYLEQAAEASQEKVWVCRETGRIYENWQAYAEPHGSFNTIVWGFPYINDNDVLVLSDPLETAGELLEAPKV